MDVSIALKYHADYFWNNIRKYKNLLPVYFLQENAVSFYFLFKQERYCKKKNQFKNPRGDHISRKCITFGILTFWDKMFEILKELFLFPQISDFWASSDKILYYVFTFPYLLQKKNVFKKKFQVSGKNARCTF